MTKNKSFAGIDYFRFIAALLIVAIHTSPLADISKTGDFILTRMICRVAVPFFFMTSGFFLISRYGYDAKKLICYIKKTLILYGVAILIYIPINIYNGYFLMEPLLPNIIRDILFDGTLYHLWYLPASIIGGIIAWYLVKTLDYKKAFAVALALYCIGLFGDSYYGIGEKNAVLKYVYHLIFQLSEETRNGIFFAPIFFIMGGFVADLRQSLSLRVSIYGFAVSIWLLVLEAMTLHFFKLQRHDSMYVFLLPCMYFLFQAILHFRGPRVKWLRTSSLIIYLIHPMLIIAVRLFAKILHLETLFIENNLVHYVSVSLASVVLGVGFTVLWDKFKPRKTRYQVEDERAYVEIDLNNLEHNAKVLQKAMPEKCELMAVVKAEAYGHGAFEISTHLDRMGVKAFAVATIDEGIRLRKYGIRGEILVLGYTNINRVSELKKYNLSQTIIDFAYAEALNEKGIKIKAHIKIDTGMNRLGVSSKDDAKVKCIFAMKYIHVEGVFTHLSCAGSLSTSDVAFTIGQIKDFYDVIDKLKSSGLTIPKLHIQSSYGLLNYPDINCDYVRVGIALFGVLSTPNEDTILKLDLRPVLSLKSKVVLIRSMKKGESMGYDRKFTAKRDSKVAILPIGYADGLPRNLSCGKGNVLINQSLVPIIGRVCMDQLVVDITDVKDISINTVATLISAKERKLSASIVANEAESITNELLSRLGRRLPVVVRTK